MSDKEIIEALEGLQVGEIVCVSPEDFRQSRGAVGKWATQGDKFFSIELDRAADEFVFERTR